MEGASAIDAADAIPAGLRPRWEDRFPGRLQYEFDALRHAGVVPEVDLEALAEGQLALTFDWRLDPATTLCLRAVFPDAFPHIRPQVFLLGGLDPLPARHRSPIEGNLCLLGRDSRQWQPSWTLCKLLDEQLEDAVRGTGDEDPQGEPADYWWNSLNHSGSYCLVDSRWDMAGHDKGTLLIRYVPTGMQSNGPGDTARPVPGIRAYIAEVRDHLSAVIHAWDSPLPPDLRRASKSIEIPWIRLDQTLLPEQDVGAQMGALRQAHPWLQRGKPHHYQPGCQFDVFAVVHPSEIGFGQMGMGWVMFFVFGHLQAFKPAEKKKKHPKRLTVTSLPVYRAGVDDIGYRVPAVEMLRTKRVLLVGAGAVGAPLAMELARNGCGTVRVIEYDIVEPGNTVRWPLGAAAWGQQKLDALAEAMAREYPGTRFVPHKHCLGQAGPTGEGPGDDGVLDPILSDVDLVIDGSASHGVTSLLADRCRETGLPLISLFATPTLEGGAVVLHRPTGGCPNCLLHAWHNGDIAPPPGNGDDDGLAQPPGCAERTFIGAGYDLQELSLQAVRLAVETLGGLKDDGSVIQTLSFVDADGDRTPPSWRVDQLPKHPDCRCG